MSEKCIDCKKDIVAKKKETVRCLSCSQKKAWEKREKGKIERVCGYCGKTFITQRSQLKVKKRGKIYEGGKYCNRECFLKYFKEHYKPTLGKTWKHTKEYKEKLSNSRKGKLNPMYVHGEHAGKKRRGVTQPQKVWRKKVFMKDNYTCQICKQKNGFGKTIQLNAHHICPWGVCKNLRFTIKNGSTLCVDCHKKVHARYRELKREIVKTDRYFYEENYNRIKNETN